MNRRRTGWRSVLPVVLVAALAATSARATGTARAQEGAAEPAPCTRAFPGYAGRQLAGAATKVTGLQIPMSDGIRLAADLTLPAGVKGPFPVVVTITGYSKSSGITSLGGAGGGLVSHGYATLLVDDRGTGASEGVWDSWGPRTLADYEELLDWIVDQSWSDGRIALTGGSYMGITALYAAATGHPAIKAVVAQVPMADSFRDIVLAGGHINTAFIPLWMGLVTGLGLLPVAEGDTLLDHLVGVGQFQLPTLLETTLGGEAAYDGPFWRQRSPIEVVDRITAPTFLVGGLDDIFQRGTPMLYERMADNADTRLLIGPWTHGTTGTGLPRDGVPSLGALELQWLDAHVRGIDTGARCIPPVTQYVRGHERYESTTSWPAPGLTAQRWWLHGTGGLMTVPPPPGGPGSEGRSYVELPVTGICSRSTNQWLIGLLGETACAGDNRFDESIGSLTYTSEPLTEELVINGPIQADVWITTTAPEATVSVAVSDVAPDGTSRGLTNGLLTASHRRVDPARSRQLDGQSIQPWHPFTRDAAMPVRPGQPMLLPIEIFPTSAAIPAGHQLRVTIAPYDVPHALPPLPHALDSVGGTVQVLSDADHPSSIVFPIASGATTAASAAGATAASLTSGAAGSASAGSASEVTGAGHAATIDAAAADPASTRAAHRAGTAAGALAALAAAAIVVTGTLTWRHRPRTD